MVPPPTVGAGPSVFVHFAQAARKFSAAAAAAAVYRCSGRIVVIEPRAPKAHAALLNSRRLNQEHEVYGQYLGYWTQLR